MKIYKTVKEFALPASEGLVNINLIEELFIKLDEIQKSIHGSDPAPSSDGMSKELAIKIGTNLFHTQKALNNALNDPSRFNSFSRTMKNKLKQTFDLMNEVKLEIVDHTGDEYFPTMKIDVLAFEENENFNKPTITETIEPTIYFNGELVKIGKVIVTQKNKQ